MHYYLKWRCCYSPFPDEDNESYEANDLDSEQNESQFDEDEATNTAVDEDASDIDETGKKSYHLSMFFTDAECSSSFANTSCEMSSLLRAMYRGFHRNVLTSKLAYFHTSIHLTNYIGVLTYQYGGHHNRTRNEPITLSALNTQQGLGLGSSHTTTILQLALLWNVFRWFFDQITFFFTSCLGYIIHLMYGKTKLTSFPRDHTLSALLYI